MINFLLKTKVAVIAASSFFSIATFIMIALNNKVNIERFIPFWLFGGAMIGLVIFNWKFLVSKEGEISARKNNFNIMIEKRLKHIEKMLEHKDNGGKNVRKG